MGFITPRAKGPWVRERKGYAKTKPRASHGGPTLPLQHKTRGVRGLGELQGGQAHLTPDPSNQAKDTPNS